MKTYPQIARAFYLEPLALEEATMLSIHMFLWPRITGQMNDVAFAPLAAQTAPPPTNKLERGASHLRREVAQPAYDQNGNITDPRYYWSAEGKPNVAVIPLNGMISKGAGSFEEACMGLVNPDRISHALAQAVAAKDVNTIVLDVGSPGGRTTYIPELAAQIRAATETRGKTVYAFSDTMIASAAQWIASQCDETIITGSAQVGSIGTYLAFLNPKVAMQTQGYSLELFSQGTHKGLGLPGRDLTQADREYLQGTVKKINDQFTAAVKAGRPKVSEEALRDAKVYDGPDAMKQGLADGVVGSWDEFLSLI